MARMPTLFVSHGSPLLAAELHRGLPSLDAYAFGLAAPAAREIRVRAAAASPPPLH